VIADIQMPIKVEGIIDATSGYRSYRSIDRVIVTASVHRLKQNSLSTNEV
jgi:hypothetical protein